ncbi:hypothetical protein [Pseudoalteromonas luteoviolacea]|uniref:hypothetical protein n=1 Tax=Pseudoalteromonas luteoviolacea TaxID=43657 RepID=UPI001B3617F6|nr:hypothetical protein [Pseudoalteromonas luteoviolacea]MBQ4838487.1 hypothetical protein [Pseudoalteromonas luteoviolacea]
MINKSSVVAFLSTMIVSLSVNAKQVEQEMQLKRSSENKNEFIFSCGAPGLCKACFEFDDDSSKLLSELTDTKVKTTIDVSYTFGFASGAMLTHVNGNKVKIVKPVCISKYCDVALLCKKT